MFHKIDQWIDRLSSGGSEDFDEDTTVNLICKRIETKLGTGNESYQILITGSVNDQYIEQIFSKLQQRLTSFGIKCDWGSCVCTDAATIQKAEVCDGIVFVEALNKTKESVFAHQIQLLKNDIRKPILGCVLVSLD